MIATAPTCAVCLSPMQHFPIIGVHICTNVDCGEEETDAQIDNRLTSEAERKHELVQSR